MEQNWDNKKLIIAEDSEINYILLQKILEKTGATLIWVKDGNELISAMAKDKDIDLILLDIHMPKLDGFSATRQLRKAGIETPVIAQSSFISASEIDEAFEAGCNDFIVKPFKKEELYAKMNALLQ
jgi:two-component system, cell cycle response regulator DivK